MKKYATLVLSFCLFALVAMGQTTTPASPCTDNIPYSYWGGTGISYESGAVSVTEAFGVKAGTCSNAMLDTIISTGVGTNSTGVSSLTEQFEYHVAHTGYWSFIAKGQLGAAQITSTSPSVTGQSSTVTAAEFGGGFAVGFDVGYALSKKKFHLPVVAHIGYTVLTSSAPLPNGGIPVKPNYTVEFRKTF